MIQLTLNLSIINTKPSILIVRILLVSIEVNMNHKWNNGGVCDGICSRIGVTVQCPSTISVKVGSAHNYFLKNESYEQKVELFFKLQPHYRLILTVIDAFGIFYILNVTLK